MAPLFCSITEGNQGIRGTQLVLEQKMKGKGITLAEAVSRDESEIVGTAESIADRLQDLFETNACDGFIVAPMYFPGMFEQF